MPEPAEASEAPPADGATPPDPRDDPATTTATPPTAAPRARAASRDWRARAADDWRLVVAAISLVLGIVLVVLGWYGAAYTNIITEQIPYLISGGLLGLGLIIVAGVMAASGAQRRDNAELRRELTRALLALDGTAGSRGTGSFLPSSSSANGHRVFVLPGGRSFHEAGCPIIEDKPRVSEIALTEAAGSGLVACKLCDPND